MAEENITVGVLGLGIIGSRVAQNLRDKGWKTFVWNRTPQDHPDVLDSPEAVAAQARVLQIFVRDGDALLSVVDQMASQLGQGHVVLNHATVSPEATSEAALRVGNTGAAFLDCPFTGSRDAANQGKLNYYVGGEQAVVEEVRAVLDASAQTVTHLGSIGHATVLKIATNMISATTVAILSEALAVCEKGGVEPSKMEQALAVNGCASGLSGMKLPTMLTGDYLPHFSLKNMLKDANFGLDMADKDGLTLPVLSSAAAAMIEQMNAGRGEEDYSVVYENYRNG